MFSPKRISRFMSGGEETQQGKLFLSSAAASLYPGHERAACNVEDNRQSWWYRGDGSSTNIKVKCKKHNV